MGRFIARRLVQAIPTIFGIMIITFALTRLSPSDPVTIMLGNNPDLTEEDREELREKLGLNDPLPVQFVRYVGDTARLDFGTSFRHNRPAIEVIGERLPNSLQLSVASLLLAIVVSVPLGLIAGVKRGRIADQAIRGVSVLLHAVPLFFLGLLFVLVFGVGLGWFPVGSMNVIGESCFFCWDRVWHMAGPVIIGATGGIAFIPRVLRTEVLEILGQDFVRTARSKGLRERVVLARHVFRNALIPIVTLFGGILTILLGGSVIIEQVFNWPGLGRLLFDAANSKDYPLVQASVLIGSLLLVVSYILRDLAYAWVDPRIKAG
ncbi:MAG: ABC transporter permease [Candidatus Limnocylindria bacterium]|nr:ABC transporter permease [Chloroflexota bacterium]